MRAFKEFLEALKVGDEVEAHDQIDRVVRLTATQIVTSHNVRWNRQTGKKVGSGHGGWRSTWLGEVTEALRDKVARNAALHVLRHTDLTGVPTALLLHVATELRDARDKVLADNLRQQERVRLAVKSLS